MPDYGTKHNRRTCKAGSEPMREGDWFGRYLIEPCAFNPITDCPGWSPGGICGRYLRPIPADTIKENAR